MKKQNKEFLQEIMDYHGVEKTFDTDVEIEIVGRYNSETNSLLVFLLNRGKKKEGTLKFLIPAKTRLPKNEKLKVKVLYTYSDSGIFDKETDLDTLKENGLKFKVRKDDCLVLHFSPKKKKVREKNSK